MDWFSFNGSNQIIYCYALILPKILSLITHPNPSKTNSYLKQIQVAKPILLSSHLGTYISKISSQNTINSLIDPLIIIISLIMKQVIVKPVGAKLTRDTEVIGKMVTLLSYRIPIVFVSLELKNIKQNIKIKQEKTQSGKISSPSSIPPEWPLCMFKYGTKISPTMIWLVRVKSTSHTSWIILDQKMVDSDNIQKLLTSYTKVNKLAKYF